MKHFYLKMNFVMDNKLFIFTAQGIVGNQTSSTAS